MIVSPLETALYQQLSDFFTERGYAFMPEKKQFRRTTPTGFENILFAVSDYDDETWIEINFGVRHEQIEHIVQQFLGNLADFREDANTLVVSVGKYNDTKYFRYKVQNEDDLMITCEEIKRFFLTRGFDFMQQYASLRAIYLLFNDEPRKPCKYLYNQNHRCFKGLVAARLCNSERFLKLGDVYRNALMRMGATPDEMFSFERMLSFLLYLSVN
jgi:hypothetical protein